MAEETVKPLPDLQRVFRNFEILDSWEERYKYIIQLGKKLPPLDPKFQTDEYKVRGCSSSVWMTSEKISDDPVIVRFRADSDAAIVKGLVAILLIIYSDKEPSQIIETDIKVIFEKLGLANHLSPTRTNGFYSMVEKIKLLAVQLSSGEAAS